MSGGGTGEFGFNVRLRDQQARKDFDRDQQANPGVSEISEAYFQDHLRREAKRRVREAREEQENRERVARWRAEEKRVLQERLLNAAYESHGVTLKERELVARMIQTKCPESLGDPAVHVLMLGRLRAMIDLGEGI